MTTHEYFATCRGGGGSVGDGVGVGSSARGVVGKRETRTHGTSLVVPAMFAPNPEVLARRALLKDRTQKRNASALNNSGASEPPPPHDAIDNSARCCCEAEDCMGNVSESHHFCSKTGRRVFAWCLEENTHEEGFNSTGLCHRCAAKEARKG